MSEEKKTNKQNFFAQIATLFIRHRELGFLTFIGIFLWGLFSFVIMPKQYNPDITAPAFQIVTEFPGATSEEVYRLITKRMEDRLKEIPTVDKVMSQSFDGGASVVIVQFYIGEDLEKAKITLIDKLRSNMSDKPFGAKDPQIKAIDPDDVPIITLALTSPTLSPASLRTLADDLVDEFKKVKGTSVLSVIGGKKKELRVNLHPTQLAQNNLTVQRIIDTIRGNNMYVLAGNLTDKDNNFKVIIDGLLKTKTDLENIVIKQEGDSVIYLKDLADIKLADEDTKSATYFWQKGQKEEPAVYLAISKLKGTNATKISQAVKKKIKELQRRQIIPADVQIKTVRDEGQVAQEATMTLTYNLFSAIVIVAAILLMFLGWKSALIVLISIPLTLAMVFGIGNLAHQNINRITLFALILSLGMLVDAAIVVVENIFRLFRENPGKNRVRLIASAVSEVGPGLVLSTTTVTLAFIPMAFVTGMMGPYMRPIPFFVPLTLISSLLIALFIIPYLLYNLSGKKGNNSNQSSEVKTTKDNRFLAFVSKLKNSYARFLHYLLNHRPARRALMFTVVILLFVSLSLPLLKIVKFRMLPKADKEQFFIYLDFPQYTTLEKTEKAVRLAENFLQENPQVVSVQSYIGTPPVVDFNGLFKGSDGRRQENQATLKVNLVHHKKRNITSEEIVSQIRKPLLEKLSIFPDLKVKLIEDPPGPPVLSTYLLKISAKDEKVLNSATNRLKKFTKNIDGLVDTDTTQNEITANYILKVKKEEASRSGLSVYQIATTLRTLLHGEKVAMYHQTEKSVWPKAEQEFIVVHSDKKNRDDKYDLDNIYLTNLFGQSIPLSSVVEYTQEKMIPVIYSDDRERTEYIYGEMDKKSVIYAMLDTLKYLLKDYRPFGADTKIAHWNPLKVVYENQKTHQQVSVRLGGEWKLTLEVFRDLGIAMAVALVMIYFVLVARFRSLRIPLLIMGTIPFSFIGVMPGFALLGWTKGVYFNATSMIGVIALSGIVVNNAIMLLEYLNQLKSEGLGLQEAIIKAGRTRLLPIMLTSLTTIFGSLTIISDPVWEGLAWSIVFGLSLAAFLTLILFPIMYNHFEKKKWPAENENVA